MGISHFKTQHDELLRLVSKISGHLETREYTMDARALRADLGQLARKITVHLAMEDNGLYSRMMASGDAEAVAMAKRFQEEMGNLGSAFTAFNRNWLPSGEIEGDPERFFGEITSLLRALQDRIERENTELYPLADKV